MTRHRVSVPLTLPDSQGKNVRRLNHQRYRQRALFPIPLQRLPFSETVLFGDRTPLVEGARSPVRQDPLCRAPGRRATWSLLSEAHSLSKGKDLSSHHLLASQGLAAPHWAVSCLANMCLLTQLPRKVTAFPQRCWFACNGAAKWPFSPLAEFCPRPSPDLSPKPNIQEIHMLHSSCYFLSKPCFCTALYLSTLLLLCLERLPVSNLFYLVRFYLFFKSQRKYDMLCEAFPDTSHLH